VVASPPDGIYLELLLVTQYERDRDLQGVGEELRRQVETAREGGLDGVGVSEHHVTDDHQYLLNEAVVAHLADAVGEMRLSTALCLLPYHNPVRIAEFDATVDVLTAGGSGSGSVSATARPSTTRSASTARTVPDGSSRASRSSSGSGRRTRSATRASTSSSRTTPSVRSRSRTRSHRSGSARATSRASDGGARIVDGFLGGHVPFDLACRQIADVRDEREATDRGP